MAGPQMLANIVTRGHILLTDGSKKKIVNSFWYRRTTPGLLTTKLGLATVFSTDVWTNISIALNNTYVADGLDVRWADDAENRFEQQLVHAGGNVVGDRLPSDDAVYFLFRSAVAKRWAHGSKHFTPASESDTVLDQLSGGGYTNWQNCIAGLEATITEAGGASSWVPTIVSRDQSQLATNPTTVVQTDVTSVLLNKTIGTMRHRREPTAR